MATQIMRGESARGLRDAGLLSELVARVSETWREYQRYRRTRTELDTLTDRELADIGLARGDIESIARQSMKVRA